MGPVRKRLSDRINEVNSVVDEENFVELKTLKLLRTKLLANMQSHEKMYIKLDALSTTDEDEQGIIDDEHEKSLQLEMNANESLEIINSHILEMEADGSKMSSSKTKEDEKLEREIEILKIEAQIKQKQLENITSGEDGKPDTPEKTVSQKINLPAIKLPNFSGQITEWQTFLIPQ